MIANRLEILTDGGYKEFTEKEVKSALEKQMSKKPKYRIDGAKFYECPVCGHLVSNAMSYCPHCGQALDWSDTE